jgi:enolase
MAKIKRIWAREILDSRAYPTVEAACQLDNGYVAVSSVPSGASTGSYEALELRDNDPLRYQGKGVLKAVENINKVLGPALIGKDPSNIFEIDKILISLDGSENKSKLGANSILGVSEAVTKAGAMANGKSLYEWVSMLAQSLGIKTEPKVPTPLFNMINGGLHGSGNLDFQEFHIIPSSQKNYTEGLRMAVEIYLTLGENLKRRGAIHSVGDEGGYAPNLFTNADAFQVLVDSIKEANYSLGRDILFGVDVAASVFFKNGNYFIRDKTTPLDEYGMLEYYKNLNEQYKLSFLEDPFQEDQWDSWIKLTKILKGQVTIIGDDLLATNPKRVDKAIKSQACNGVLVKPNQIGTVSETMQVVKMAKEAGWEVVVSHRSGESNDWFIADFAVGVGADHVKFGAPARGERIAKYNRLLSIDTELSYRNQNAS